MNCILWNMFSSIKNAQSANKKYIFQKNNYVCTEILNILWNEGFILGYKICKFNSNTLKIFLKYTNETPCINLLVILTKPGYRFYFSAKQLWKLNVTKGLIVFSTTKGFLTLEECKKLKLGGEPFLIIK